MSENLNSTGKNGEYFKTGRHQSSNTLDDEGSNSSPGSVRKNKASFFGSLRHTKKKHKSIEILKGQDFYAEETSPVKWQDQKEGDAERINLLNSVKEGRMSIEEAMKQAEELGVNYSSSYSDVPAEETIFNFGVYKYTKNRASCSRRILQFDFQEKVLCTIQKGSRGKKFEFSQIRGFDSEDGVRFYIYFEEYHDYELDADTTEEKNKICTLLESIVQQNKTDEPDGVFEAPVFVDKLAIKEGQVEKKGHSAAFMMWPRRWLRVQSGELSYYKIGEENQAALNIIKLGPGQADVKKIEHNGFLITTSKKEYSFRVVAKEPQAETKERDDWVEAIGEGSQVTKRKSRNSSIIQDQVFTNSLHEQEQYIKDVVKTLQRELEQLTSVLTVVNAPIQATIQVKKVKEVVSEMDTHVKTGVLSWTMRQIKNRSESQADPDSPSKALPGRVSRQHSTNSRTGQPGLAITPIDEGYESIVPPKRPPKTSTGSSGSADQTTYDTVPSRSSPHATTTPAAPFSSTSPKCPLAGETNPQQFPPRPSTTDASSPRKEVAQVAPYETVDITSQSPSGSLERHKPSPSLYQQPTSNRQASFESYDNVNIKNQPVSAPGPLDQDNEVDAAKRRQTEVDAGGMGCESIDQAVQERKEFYCEEQPNSLGPPAPPPPPPPGGVPPPPPPPPGMGGSGPPPPPPPMGGGTLALDSALPSRKVPQPRKKLKPFFWNKVPLQMVTQSLWLGAQDRTNHLNLETLEEMFHMEDRDKPLPQVSNKPTTKMLLDPKRAHNLGIFLSGFKLTAQEIDMKLGLFKEEEGALPIDHVIALKRFLPTPDEQEMYKNIKVEDIPGLLQEDQFMIKLCEIPDLDKRLDLLLVIMEFPSQYEELAPAVSNVLEACHQLYGSHRFQIVLEYVLAIGNYINGGTNRGGAYGFRLTTLTKMADIRGKDRKNTLLKYLIMQLKQTTPDTLLFLEELKIVSKAADASIKGLSAEVEVMRKDLGKIMKHSSDLFLKYKRTEYQDVKLIRDVDSFVEEYEEKLKELCDKCKEMKYIYGKLLTRFGESPTMDSEELFTALTTFVGQFKKTLNDVETGPSDKKRIKLDGLNEAIAARVAARLPAKDTATSNASSTTGTNNGTTDSPAATMERMEPSNAVDGAKPPTINHINSKEEKEARCVVPDLKPFTSPPQTNSPKIVHKKLSVKQHSPTPERSTTARPTKEGFLDKLSGGKHKNPKWDNRYFELAEGGHLHYYKKADGKVINTIYLRGCPVSLDEQDPTIIRIKTEEREWNLKATDVDEAKEWKKSIEFYTQKTNSL